MNAPAVVPSEPIAAWHGKRMGVEVPSEAATMKKDLDPEILNRSFLWNEDYHHYADWESKMKASYDNFNMLFIPHQKQKGKLFFDEQTHKRRIPTGIVPHPFTLRKPVQLPRNI